MNLHPRDGEWNLHGASEFKRHILLLIQIKLVNNDFEGSFHLDIETVISDAPESGILNNRETHIIERRDLIDENYDCIQGLSVRLLYLRTQFD